MKGVAGGTCTVYDNKFLALRSAALGQTSPGGTSLPQDHRNSGQQQLRTTSPPSRKGQPIVVCAGLVAGWWKWDILNIWYKSSRAGQGQKDMQESGLTLRKRCAWHCVYHMGSSKNKQWGQAWEMAATGKTKLFSFHRKPQILTWNGYFRSLCLNTYEHIYNKYVSLHTHIPI